MFDVPVVYAFSAGMVATINPCGFALLPAYIAYHLRLGDESRSAIVRATHGVLLGLMATMGFVALFGFVGLIVTAGGRVLIRFFPYWGLAVGVALVCFGLFLLITRRHIGIRVAGRIQSPNAPKGVWGFFVFGIAYGLASLSCTLPIFLVVVGSALAAKGFLSGVVQFVSYGLGMGTILIAVTVGVVFLRTAISRGTRVVIPYVDHISSIALIAAGSYLIYYWTMGPGGEVLFV